MGVADVGGHVLRTSRISALCPPHFLQTLLSSVSSSRFVSPGPAPIRNGLNGKGRMHSQKSTTDKKYYICERLSVQILWILVESVLIHSWAKYKSHFIIFVLNPTSGKAHPDRLEYY